MDRLYDVDPEIAHLLVHEEERQRTCVQLIASENYASQAVMDAQGSVATNKYAEGLPGKRYYGGCEFVDGIESLAIERAKQLYGAAYVNVQPHSGSSANLAVYHALLEPGDTILGMSLDAGGHLSHGHPVNVSGKLFNAIHYGVNDQGLIDYDQVSQLAQKYKPKLIIAGFSAYSQVINWAFFAEVAKSCGAYFLADMAHVSGLIAAGQYPSPIPHADIVTSTTHKTLRGPRGGMILSRSVEMGKKINRSIFPGMQGGPLMHVIAAKAVCYHEAMTPSFKIYQQQVVRNAQVMAKALMDAGYHVISGEPQCHMFLLSLEGKKLNGAQAQDVLDRAGITVNKNAIPNDQLPPTQTSGLRIGLAAMTTRGMTEEQTLRLTQMIVTILDHPDEETIADIAEGVSELLSSLSII